MSMLRLAVRHTTGGAIMKILLWLVQILLAGLFLFAGGVKLILPLGQMQGPVALPGWFLRFLGIVEILGALGLILPGLLRIKPGLTSLAASGLVVIMIGAVTITLGAGMLGVAVFSFVVGILCAFVAHYRSKHS